MFKLVKMFVCLEIEIEKLYFKSHLFKNLCKINKFSSKTQNWSPQ